jgi:hypothetical protein
MTTAKILREATEDDVLAALKSVYLGSWPQDGAGLLTFFFLKLGRGADDGPHGN